MGVDYCSILSTADVTPGVLQHTLGIILHNTGCISKESKQKVENMTSVDELTEVGLLGLKKKKRERNNIDKSSGL